MLIIIFFKDSLKRLFPEFLEIFLKKLGVPNENFAEDGVKVFVPKFALQTLLFNCASSLRCGSK
jgi:hypothetical protein